MLFDANLIATHIFISGQAKSFKNRITVNLA
jgi:hypothetical protein